MNIGEIVRGAMKYTIPGAGECLNVFHWQLTQENADDDDVGAALADWAENDWGAAWDNQAANGAIIDLIDLDIVTIDGLVDRNLGAETIDINGDIAASVLPAANSLYVQANCGPAGVFGRKYVPGFTEDQQLSGNWQAGVVAVGVLLLVALATTVTESVSGGVLVPGVPSSKTEEFEPFLTTGFTTIIPAYQRRRKPGVGQ